jgi:tetratricopeptide (TPR) repeat protein
MRIKSKNHKQALWSLPLLLLGLLLFTTPSCAQLHNQKTVSLHKNILFNQANDFYEKAEYTKAIQLYSQLTSTGYESGNLYYNLGNAYFKQGHKGWAIFYYEKARRLISFDQGLKVNLKIALNEVDEGEINWGHEFYRSLTYLAPLNLLTLVSSICFFILILLIISMLLFPALTRNLPTGKLKTGYRIFLILNCFLLLLFVSLTTLNYLDQHQNQAVAIQGNAPVLSEPNSQGTVYFKLAEGSRILVNSTKDNWYLIRRQDGKRGWVERQYLERL